ncbi:TadE/TadG family type IV pilus assembly protein [Robiginitomaculum antarcticum]|uniref:TadE/TadG family type IV pilus assembly protein n=1 Tax=Robiginitomaculum antarcticum TaxID=437507 RepID=UPI00037F84A7|nr:TadE/TadG family type IV pilus assembly protein [Robiginitomaculum antarcticum]
MRALNNTASRFLRDKLGAITAEAALIFPVLILLGLGAVDYSNLLYQKHMMETSLTSAGIYLSKTRDPQSREGQAKALAITGHIMGGEAKLRNWTADDITISYAIVDNTKGDYRSGETVTTVQLSTELAYTGMGLINAVAPGDIIMRANYEERIVGEGV